jgi:hypothetical protein
VSNSLPLGLQCARLALPVKAAAGDQAALGCPLNTALNPATAGAAEEEAGPVTMVNEKATSAVAVSQDSQI